MLLSDCISSRINEIQQELYQKNGKYALATEICRHFYETIDPIIKFDRDITISKGDCHMFRDFLEYDAEKNAILEQELYQQGYRDCIKLLATLGVLPK